MLEAIIRYRQEQRFNNPRVDKPKSGIIFANIRREDADNSLLDCMKFMANYFFYKYGLEVKELVFIFRMAQLHPRLLWSVESTFSKLQNFSRNCLSQLYVMKKYY